MEGLIFVIFLMICATAVYAIHKLVCRHEWEDKQDCCQCKKCKKIVYVTCQHEWEETARDKIVRRGARIGYFIHMKCKKCGELSSRNLSL